MRFFVTTEFTFANPLGNPHALTTMLGDSFDNHFLSPPFHRVVDEEHFQTTLFFYSMAVNKELSRTFTFELVDTNLLATFYFKVKNLLQKIPIPYNPEAGFGAIAPDGTLVLNELLVTRLKLKLSEIKKLAQAVQAKIKRREEKY